MRLIDADELTEMVWRERVDTRERIANLIARQPTIEGAVKRCKMNKCYFCGKECGETVLTVNDKTLFQSELFRAYMCAECSEAVHSALILLRTITKGTVKHGRWECVGHDDTTYWYRCSVCGHEEHDNMTKHDSYCPNCGADMRGDPDV